jgi:DNA-binding LacI/PurR family transcriptional regulator
LISREIAKRDIMKMKSKTVSNSKVRLSDIARKANVSRITVSKALLNTGGGNVRISEETRKKILEIAESMNYKPNMAARMLAGKKSKIIGALIDSHAPLCLYDCLRMIERKLAEKGYRFMIAQQHDDLGSIVEYIKDFSTYGVEGIISFAHSYPEFKEELNEILKVQPNILYIGKPEIKDCNYLEIDIKAGIKDVVKHLIQKGKKKIGIFLINEKIRTMRLRYDGYMEALREHGIKPDKKLVFFNEKFKFPSDECASEIVDYFLNKVKADAIIALNDNHAARVINCLKKKKIRTPEDIAVTGCDNMDISEIFSPPITTLEHRYDLLAEEAVKTLLDLVELKKSVSSKSIKPELIIRESS